MPKAFRLGPLTFIGGSFYDCTEPSGNPSQRANIRLERSAPHKAKSLTRFYDFPVPDFSTPKPETARRLADKIWDDAEAGELSEVFVGCTAGRGRTGTMLGVFLMVYRERYLASFWKRVLRRFFRRPLPVEFEPEDPVRWIRENYKEAAIETPEQEEFVRGFTRNH